MLNEIMSETSFHCFVTENFTICENNGKWVVPNEEKILWANLVG